MIKVKSLVWDEWNIEHIKKHKIEVDEAEEVCKKPEKTLLSYKERLIVLGKTKKQKLLTIVLAPMIKNKYYVVTARAMSRKERRLTK